MFSQVRLSGTVVRDKNPEIEISDNEFIFGDRERRSNNQIENL